MELIPFSSIDEYADDVLDHYTPEQIEAAGFFQHLDWEGGFDGLIYYDTNAFPEELRPLAEAAYDALENLRKAAEKWGEERGVSY